MVHEPPRRCQISLPVFRKLDGNDSDDDVNASGMGGLSLEDDQEEEEFQYMRSSGAMVSDYLFPGETPYESVESVKEVFGFYPTIDTMDDDMEVVASPQQMVRLLYVTQSHLYSPKIFSHPAQCRRV